MPGPQDRTTVHRRARTRHWLTAAAILGFIAGCTSPGEWRRNGFKVGPNYATPTAPTEADWIDVADKRIRRESDEVNRWWKVFRDPTLDGLVCDAYRQNLTLRQAGFKVLEARYQREIAVGNLFPQTQQMNGDYYRFGTSKQTAGRLAATTVTTGVGSTAGTGVGGSGTGTGGAGTGSTGSGAGFGISSAGAKRFFGQWDLGFGLAWELDFWGRYRRAIEAATGDLEASTENYDAVLVTMLGDLAGNYVQLRTVERRIALLRQNVKLQQETLSIATARFKGGQASELDVDQSRTTLYQTASLIPPLEIQHRVLANAMCVLLGIPPEHLEAKLGTAPIPTVPPEVGVGMPADLIRRRPDVRRAERLAAAQSARIGIAQAEFLPHISIIGQFGYSAESFNHLWGPSAFNGQVGPQFRWNILNYGRILNNVRFQDTLFQEAVTNYQQSMLVAAQEVENGIVSFLKQQERVQSLGESVTAAQKAVEVAVAQYRGGLTDFNRVAVLQQTLVQQQDALAQAQGDIALSLILIYRALGGGWQVPAEICERSFLAEAAPAGKETAAPEKLPPPAPAAPSPTVPATPTNRPRLRLRVVDADGRERKPTPGPLGTMASRER